MRNLDKMTSDNIKKELKKYNNKHYKNLLPAIKYVLKKFTVTNNDQLKIFKNQTGGKDKSFSKKKVHKIHIGSKGGKYYIRIRNGKKVKVYI